MSAGFLTFISVRLAGASMVRASGNGHGFIPRVGMAFRRAVVKPARTIADRVPWDQIPEYVQSFLQNKEFGRYISTWLEQNVWKLARHPEKQGVAEEAARHFSKLPNYFYLFGAVLVGGRQIDAGSRFISGSALTYLAQPANFLLPSSLFGPYSALDDLLVCSVTTRALEDRLGSKWLNRFWLGEGNVLKDAQDMYAFCEATLASLLFRKVERWLKRPSGSRPKA
jgi:hypothetical protein